MTHDFLQTQQEIYESLRDSLTGRITQLTNFTDRSFNYVWTQAFSEEVRELQELSLVAELAGFVDYVGGPITEDDIAQLGLEGQITAERVNELMRDEYLDEYVKIVGISRDSGGKATGEVTFTTQQSATTVPSGTRVTTDTDESGDTIDFLTTEDASNLDGEVEITDVPIEAIDEGTEFKIPANEIVRVSNPPIGVTGVFNNASTTGGDDEETNDELRARAKKVVGGASEGGTVEGIKAYIRNNIDAVDEGDVSIDEEFGSSTNRPEVDVIVDGGNDTNVEEAIDFSRPTGIFHKLVRPEIVQIGLDIDLIGTDVDLVELENNVENFLLELGLSENLYRDQLVLEVMRSDKDIINIDFLDAFIERVTGETFVYDGSTFFRLDYTYDKENGTITIEDASGDNYVEGNDFEVRDQTGDSYFETIEWVGGATPDADEEFFVDYDVTVVGETKNGDVYNTDLVRDEIFTFNLSYDDTITYNNSERSYLLDFVPFGDNISITDGNTTFTEDVDWQLAPLSGFETEDTFTFDVATAEYTLSTDIEIDDVAIIDADDNIYVRDTDYQTIDIDGDTFDETVSWDVDIDGAVSDDGGAQTTETAAANDSTADDIALLPAGSAATGDAYYFGYENEFSGFDIYISTAGVHDGAVAWEYYDGASWTALSNVVDNTDIFRNSGRNSVEFTRPSDWSTTTVNSISNLYWIRARWTSISNLNTEPVGQEVEIGRKPDDGVNFTVSYDAYHDAVRWDQSGEDNTPPQDDDFTVTYDQALYEPELEIVETPGGVIRAENSGPYNEDTEYIIKDRTRDKEKDSIVWTTKPLSDGEEFYFTYNTEGDILFTNREKADAGTINAEVN